MCTGWRKKTGPPYLIANILKIPWPNCMEIGELLQYYILNTVINFRCILNRHQWRSNLAKTQLLCDTQIYLYNVNKRQLYLCFHLIAPQRDEIFKQKVYECDQHIILQKFTNFHAIRSWNFRIFAMRWWPRFLRHPVFGAFSEDNRTMFWYTFDSTWYQIWHEPLTNHRDKRQAINRKRLRRALGAAMMATVAEQRQVREHVTRMHHVTPT